MLVVASRVFFLIIRGPPRSPQSRSSAASDVYKRQPEWDTNYLRLTAGLENVQGERLSCLYDSLTAMAVADMLKAGYGVRGAVGCLLYTSPSPRDQA